MIDGLEITTVEYKNRKKIVRTKNVSLRHVINVCVLKISKQFDRDIKEHRLMLGVLTQAAADLIVRPLKIGAKQGTISKYYDDLRNQADAQKWFAGDMDVLQLCGIDPDWVRHVFKRAGVDLA